MKFDLHRPCSDCPFRSDIDFYLSPARVLDILTGVLQEQETFTCHHTISGQRRRQGYTPGANDQHCAGILLLIHHEGFAHSMLQIAERLGWYDPAQLDRTAPAFATVESLLEHFGTSLAKAPALAAWVHRERRFQGKARSCQID